MTRTRQILFIQGGGAGAHDDWDSKLVESLRRELGPGTEVRFPRMPNEADPSFGRWKPAVAREIAERYGAGPRRNHNADIGLRALRQ